MADPKKRELSTLQDEIDIVLRHCGVTTPDLDRLARIAFDMQHLEWELARRQRAHYRPDPAGPGDGS